MHPGKRSSGPRKRKPTCRINGARSPSKDCPRLSVDRRMQSSSEREDYEYQGIRSISGKDILKDRELMDGAEFQELEPVVNK